MSTAVWRRMIWFRCHASLSLHYVELHVSGAAAVTDGVLIRVSIRKVLEWVTRQHIINEWISGIRIHDRVVPGRHRVVLVLRWRIFSFPLSDIQIVLCSLLSTVPYDGLVINVVNWPLFFFLHSVCEPLFITIIFYSAQKVMAITNVWLIKMLYAAYVTMEKAAISIKSFSVICAILRFTKYSILFLYFDTNSVLIWLWPCSIYKLYFISSISVGNHSQWFCCFFFIVCSFFLFKRY